MAKHSTLPSSTLFAPASTIDLNPNDCDRVTVTAKTAVSTSRIVTCLPPDVIGEICANIPPCKTGYTLDTAPINASQVSRHWREGALSRGDIWCNVVEIIGKDPIAAHHGRLAVFKQFLMRSAAGLPLHITISPTPLREENEDNEDRIVYERHEFELRRFIAQKYFYTIEPYRHRYETLHIDFGIKIPSSQYPITDVSTLVIEKMPMLKDLHINYPTVGPKTGIIDLSESTHIQSCTVIGCWSMRIAKGLSLSGLVYLSIEFGIGNKTKNLVSSFYQALRQTPNLETLVVSLYEGIDWRSTGPILLSKLLKLSIVLREEDKLKEDGVPAQAFFTSVSCPMLTTLELYFGYRFEAAVRAPFVIHDGDLGLCSFLDASNCSLDSLTIGYDVLYEDELWDVLTSVHCKNLRELYFSGIRFADDSTLPNALHTDQGMVADQMTILQYLQHLTFYRCHIPREITASEIVDMVDHMREHASLRSFVVEGCNVKGFKEDPRIKAMKASKSYLRDDSYVEYHYNPV